MSNKRPQHLLSKYLRSRPVCEMCLAQLMKRKADVVHHIIHTQMGGSKERHTEDNLISLCNFHHGWAHPHISMEDVDKEEMLRRNEMMFKAKSNYAYNLNKIDDLLQGFLG